MGFKAQGAVPALEWDFRPYVDASGVSPEPSGTAMFTFQQNYTNAVQAAKRQTLSRGALADQKTERSADEMREELQKWASYSFEEAIEESGQLLESIVGTKYAQELIERIAGLIDELTGGCPNRQQILDLPGRIRSTYIGWFVGEVSNPEA